MIVQIKFYSILVFFTFKIGFSQNPVELPYDIVNSFSTPGPNPQGLAWESTNLWIADDSTDFIYSLNPTDGAVKSFFKSPGPKPRGLTYDGEFLWNLDDSLKQIFKLNTNNGVVVDSIQLPFEIEGLGSIIDYPFLGLTWDGDYFWISLFAGWSSSVIRINPFNGTADSSFYCDAEGLTFDGTYLWNVDSQDGYATGLIKKRIIPSGNEIAYFRPHLYYPTGLTFDSSYLWLADSGTDSLYQIEVQATGIEDNYETPNSFILFQNYPNPFNLETTIMYTLMNNGIVDLSIYSMLGQKIVTLVRKKQQSGEYTVTFNATDLASGFYLCRLEAPDYVGMIKILLVK